MTHAELEMALAELSDEALGDAFVLFEQERELALLLDVVRRHGALHRTLPQRSALAACLDALSARSDLPDDPTIRRLRALAEGLLADPVLTA